MRLPKFITFTGIDDRTNLTRADKLAERYPIEWGVLFAQNARDSRFPSVQAVSEMVSITGAKSAHLCGSYATKALNAETLRDVPLTLFDRVQINGSKLDLSRIGYLTEIYSLDVIIQQRGSAFDKSASCYQLFDRSGGRGVFPEEVPPLLGDSSLVGYSGGIGPESVKDYISLIKGSGDFWIDMEGNVRTEGWFDLDLVERVCETVFYKG